MWNMLLINVTCCSHGEVGCLPNIHLLGNDSFFNFSHLKFFWMYQKYLFARTSLLSIIWSIWFSRELTFMNFPINATKNHFKRSWKHTSNTSFLCQMNIWTPRKTMTNLHDIYLYISASNWEISTKLMYFVILYT